MIGQLIMFTMFVMVLHEIYLATNCCRHGSSVKRHIEDGLLAAERGLSEQVLG